MKHMPLRYVVEFMRRAVAINLNESERQGLEQLKRGRRVSVRLAERAAIVLLAAEGRENQDIAAELGITRQKAGRWRRRYVEQGLPVLRKTHRVRDENHESTSITVAPWSAKRCGRRPQARPTGAARRWRRRQG